MVQRKIIGVLLLAFFMTFVRCYNLIYKNYWCSLSFLSLQPVYLLLRLKKGKGNETPSYDSQTSVERRKILAHKISINGETVDYAQDELNIHDYAEFERSDELIPEFRLSIKSKGPPPKLTRQKQSLDEGTGVSGENEANTSASAVSPKKTRSFQNIARQVCLMEHALKMGPGRNHKKRHSSSSEDLFVSDKV